ncbi:ABC1 kinase family protein [Subtercola frigoramans]|uniref:Ubiquinone biosynthesis protein n=1 Tax=Subtercola frigoramans TaxID=120298 RepID=A0ABS2L3H6_9MICO|nr:AarF/ABC1/UbiB kinase family protein [Subtercola frigoramans]MBM7471657.1 ubiquinone biosynthesis protein [Subtercola frigoramans]
MAIASHIERYRQIAAVLARHGFGFILGASGLDRFELANLVTHAGGRTDVNTGPQQLRLAFEELGPTFVKLGQLLSTRSDLLPPAYVAELQKLQDSARPVPEKEVRDAIEQELGDPAEKVFASFTSRPLASASIGQAHAATMKDGMALVVKVRRPGIVAQVNEDLEIMQNLAVQASRHWSAASDFNIVGITDEFSTSLRFELDYLHEGHNAERFAENFASNPGIHIPAIRWETTTSRVLTIERVTGIRIDDVAALDAAGIDRRALANRAVDAVAQMILEDGFFHADPHPGNMFVEPDGTIGLIDFGMVGEIDDDLRDRLVALLLAFGRNDAGRISTAVVNLSVSQENVDRVRLKGDLTRFLAKYHNLSLSELHIGPLVSELVAVLRNNHLQLRQEIALLVKMLVMVEGMGVTLDPAFTLSEALRPYTQKLLAEKYSLKAVVKNLGKAGLSVAELGAELPDRLRSLLDVVDTTGFEVHLRAKELEPLVGRAEVIGNRLVAGVIAAALIRGVGEFAATDRQRWQAWERPLMGAGVGLASILSGYLLWTARRKRP